MPLITSTTPKMDNATVGAHSETRDQGQPMRAA
jgi:hypothetical protein